MDIAIDYQHNHEKNEGCKHEKYLYGYRKETDKGYMKPKCYLNGVVLGCKCGGYPKDKDWPVYVCNYVSHNLGMIAIN